MAKSFDRVADIYDETRRMAPEAMAGIMKNIIEAADPSSGPAIEIGIGTGRIAVPLAEKGFRIVGVDISEKMLMRLMQKLISAPLSINVVRGDVNAMPFADHSFDTAIAVHVFHLLDDVAPCIKETRRVLRRGGCLLFGGEQRMLGYVDQALFERHALRESLMSMLREAGIKLPDQSEVVRNVIEAAGKLDGSCSRLAPVEWDYEITCAEIIKRIEGRFTSSMWNAPEEKLRVLIDRLRPALAENVGPPSTSIRFRRRFDMFCMRFR